MKYFSVNGVGFDFINAFAVKVECVQSKRLPYFQFIGAAPAAMSAARERIMAAFGSSSLGFPSRRVTVRISPNVPADGMEALDLPIALAILGSMGMISQDRAANFLACGALGLDGQLHSSVENMVLKRFIRRNSPRGAILSWKSSHILNEEGVPNGGGFRSLREVLDFLRSERMNAPRLMLAASQGSSRSRKNSVAELEIIKGLALAKRVLEIAAAGMHHTLLLGPRGVGKSSLARSLPVLLPVASPEVLDEARMIHRLAGEPFDGGPSFRDPDSQLTSSALLGGGRKLVGEISLAHGGVLFLDELLARDRKFLDGLRVPMERGVIHRSGAEIPAGALVVGAANLCPCGAKGDRRAQCRCNSMDIGRHLHRLSFALEERFDLKLTILPKAEEEEEARQNEDISTLLERIERARALMLARQSKVNGRLILSEVPQVKSWDAKALQRWRSDVERFACSLRATAAIGRVAITISDLAAAESVQEEHVLEAIHYRSAAG